MSAYSIQALLGERGRVAELLPGFAARDQQQAMARKVLACIEDSGTLVCEAGTGTGKTLAYLVAVLSSERRCIISTGTKNLQEQLYTRDLPLALSALDVEPDVALLKGRSNYLCRHRLLLTERDPPRQRELQAELSVIRAWSGRSLNGDIAECVEVPESSSIWARVTSTVDNCLGHECPSFDECHVVQARKAAADADIVVVNHHLFFADLALRQEGFAELLPGVQAVVFDEAHQLPEIATRFFGVALSAGQIKELTHDVLAAQRAEARDTPDLADAVAELDVALAEFVQALGATGQRRVWRELSFLPGIERATKTLRSRLECLADGLELLAERGRGLESCERRARDLLVRLLILCEQDDARYVRWIENREQTFTWRSTPLEVATFFAEHISQSECAWVFTSATLSIGDSVEHFADRLGLSDYEEAIWHSPFDYRHQTLCYVPPDMPAPGTSKYTESVVQAALPILKASGGRAFLLFTSHAALERAAKQLKHQAEFRLFVQGQMPRDELLRRFRSARGAVLLGTSSFWEGVDVRGDALVVVVIDKLPFAAPDDPVLQARLKLLSEQGDEPFISYQLPQAVIALKQGVGRLIRDEGDCGVLMLCDPRVVERGYGKLFFRSLPPMPVTRSQSDAVEFLRMI